MRTERQIAEQIFQLFRNTNCKENQGFVKNVLDLQVVLKLNPKEQELFKIVYIGLQALQYISVDEDGRFIRLTRKGYDYIYDEELVEKMQSIPWVIPEYKGTNWIVAWNKLWKIIGDVPRESQYYYSGPKFLKVICELDNTVEADYSRYIEFRRNKGLSISRKDYFRDLIDGIDEAKRYEFYLRIQETFEDAVYVKINTTDDEINPFLDIDSLFSNQNNQDTQILGKRKMWRNFENLTENGQQTTDSQLLEKSAVDEDTDEYHPKVFISYSWDDEEHKKWVLNLATKLRENGIDAILDQWEISNKGGSLIPNFMIKSVSTSERVLCIMTPNYKLKTDKITGGVGFEYSILSSELADDLQSAKFIPILRKGEDGESTPILLKQRIAYYMREEDDFEVAFSNLLRDLYNEPKTVKPALGKKPKFD